MDPSAIANQKLTSVNVHKMIHIRVTINRILWPVESGQRLLLKTAICVQMRLDFTAKRTTTHLRHDKIGTCATL